MTDYCELDDMKVQTQLETDVRDAALNFLIPRASRAIDRWCGREDNWFVALTEATAREYPGSGKSYQHIDECVEITLVEVKDSPTDTDYVSWTASDWLAYTGSFERPNYNKTPYMAIKTNINGSYHCFTGSDMPTVRVTAKWGYATTVPGTIEEACIIQVARWFKRGESSWSDAVARGDFGELRFTKKLDPDVQSLLYDGGWVDPRRRM